MILLATWKLIVPDRTIFSGHRIKRITSSNPTSTPFDSGTDTPTAGSSWSRTAPNACVKGGDTYVFAFWSVTAREILNGDRLAVIVPGNTASISLSGSGVWIVDATAWYFWDQGQGGGPHAVYFDAFNIDLGDWMADDFVDVADDPTGVLTAAANNGMLDTGASVPATARVTARETWSTFTFSHWGEFALAGPANGLISGRDVTVHHGDIFLAVGFYNQPEQPLPRRPHFEIYDALWWIKTHGGLTPVMPPWGPPEPWWREMGAASLMATQAAQLPPELREALLRTLLEHGASRAPGSTPGRSAGRSTGRTRSTSRKRRR